MINMVGITNAGIKVGGRQYIEFAGLSTDTKPTDGIATGSLFHEVDTKKVYAFNEDGNSGEEWIEQMTLGGDA